LRADGSAKRNSGLARNSGGYSAAAEALAKSYRALGADGSALVRAMLIDGLTSKQIAEARGLKGPDAALLRPAVFRGPEHAGRGGLDRRISISTAVLPKRSALCHGHRMRPMTKVTIIVLLALAATTTQASAQSRTFYDASGKVVGRSSTDSSGTVRNYDASGRVVRRESTSGNQTTIYDASGRNVGRFTTNR
jgi:YD repeat-containing protein